MHDNLDFGLALSSAFPSPSTRSLPALTTRSTPIVSFAGLRQPCVQAEAPTGLFIAHFVEGRDIGDRKVLIEIASDCGLDAGEVEKAAGRWRADADLVRQDIEQAQAMGVSEVRRSSFLGGRLEVPGTQEPSERRQAMAEARQAMAAAANTPAASA